MKTIQVPARLPEKQDIIESFENLTNEEIKRFVCKFEGLENINEFKTKAIPTKRFGDIIQLQKVRHSKKEEEYYSGKTAAVYKVSHHDKVMYFEDIHFKENRPDEIGYGLDPDTAKAIAYCKKCNCKITPGYVLNDRNDYRCDCKK
jgi:hypothetical protein